MALLTRGGLACDKLRETIAPLQVLGAGHNPSAGFGVADAENAVFVAASSEDGPHQQPSPTAGGRGPALVEG